MKKSSAIVVLCVLVTSGAFAELAVSGVAGAGSTLLKGSTARFDGKNDSLKVSNYLKAGIELSDQSDNGTLGGNVRLDVEITDEAFNFDPRAFVWWQPIPNIKLQLGSIDDFGLTDIVGWGYHANDAEEYVVSPKSAYAGRIFANTTGFYSGTGSGWFGASLTLSPFYGLTLTVAFPFGQLITTRPDITDTPTWASNFPHFDQPDASQVYARAQAQVAYEIFGIGRAVLSFAGGGNGQLKDWESGFGYDSWDDLTNERNAVRYEDTYLTANAHTIFASFFITALEDLGMYFNAGVGYTLPVTGDDISVGTVDGIPDYSFSGSANLSYQPPIEAGLAFSLGSDTSGIKAQLAATFAGKMTVTSGNGASFDVPVKLGLGVLPYFTVGIFKINVNAGISFRFAEYESFEGKARERPNSAAFGWFLNPYATVNLGVGTLFAGLQVQSTGITRNMQAKEKRAIVYDGFGAAGGPVIQFGIPIGIQLLF